MSQRLNLNDNTKDAFEFSIGGFDYDLKYPTLEELEPITELNDERSKAEKEKDTEKLAELDKQLEDTFYGFIRPVNGAPDIRETLKKQPFPVVKAFNKMLARELSVD